MSTIQTVLQPGEHIIWEKPKVTSQNYVSAILRSFLTFLVLNVIASIIILGGLAYELISSKGDPMVVGYYMVDVLTSPILPFLLILALIGIVISNLVEVHRGKLVLTDKRILIGRLEINRCDIQQEFFRENYFSLRYKAGRVLKMAGMHLGKNVCHDFQIAYKTSMQNTD